MTQYSWQGNKELYALQKQRELQDINYSENFELLSLTRGNTFGYIYSEDLKEDDNIWLEDYPIEKYFDLTNYEICEMSLYGIQGNYTNEEKEVLRKRLDKILKKYEADEFKKELRKLYKENILMIDFCSC